jgi:hypothetical protein
LMVDYSLHKVPLKARKAREGQKLWLNMKKCKLRT